MNPLIQRKITSYLLIPLALLCFGLLPGAQAVNPPPDGGYGNQNTAEGTDALHDISSGVWNTAVGFDALFNNTIGNQNTATGHKALFANVSGDKSVAYGAQALTNNSTGTQNTATGFSALFSNTTGDNNTANGYRALNFSNGNDNTATGFNALYNHRTGSFNTATGSQALAHDFEGHNNTACGFQALYSNTGSSFNTAMGNQALYGNIAGFDNTAAGDQALYSNASGAYNTAVSNRTLYTNVDGNDNTAVGWDAGYFTTGSGNICIGSGAYGVTGEEGTIRIGGNNSGYNACYITGIDGTTVIGSGVVVNSSNQLGVAPSSSRFKNEIKPMDKASEAVLALKPVTFRYKKEIDAQGIPQFGLVAEAVEAVNPDLVVRDKQGKPFTVRYDAVNAMLLNEFLKEHKKVEQLEKDFESKFAEQQKQIEALSAGLQKVTADVEMSRSAPQMVVNEQ
jgi:hypothetical protein